MATGSLLTSFPKVITKLTNDVQNNDGIPCVPNKLLNVEAIPFCSKNSEENDLQAMSKVLKKPDKIFPCPRCNSMETKFRCFNNHNVNQPRHFCRNCQRCWTAGGAMRNVPVGAGRRRYKHASHFRHAMVPCDDIVAAPGDVSEVIHHQALPLVPPALPGPIKENETVTEFGSEVPGFESMSSILHIENQKNTDFVSLDSGDNKEENSCAYSAAVSGCSENRMSGYCN